MKIWERTRHSGFLLVCCRMIASALTLALLLSGCSVSVHAVKDGMATPVPTSTAIVGDTASVQSAETSTATPVVSIPTPTPTVPDPTATATSTAPLPDPTPAPLPTPTQASPTQVARATTPPPPSAPTPTPTPVPAISTPMPSTTPTPSALACTDVPVRGIGLLWSSNPAVAQAIGCPVSAEVGLEARAQLYQNGAMVWFDTLTAGIDQSPWVVTLIDTDATRYRVPVEVPEWKDGATAPSGAFKWVWDNVYSDQQRLGYALAPLYSTDGAIQRFEHGTMIWLKTPPGGGEATIYVIQNDLVSTSTGIYQQYLDQSAQ